MKNLFFTSVLLVAFLLNAHATKHIITTSGLTFSPNSINVTVGDTVRWEWGGSISHTTTSSSIPSGALPWNIPLNASSLSFEYPVTEAGTYNYHCTIHNGMNGTFTAIVVTDPCDTLNCDDFDACTTDTCTNSACLNTPINCDDGDSCTTDACNTGCTHTAILGCGVGINEPSELASLLLFPNPVQDVLSIEGANSPLTRVYITDITGKQVFDSGEINLRQYSIQTNSFINGTYFLHLYSSAGEAVRKVVVRK